jgi:hypothetical protein
MDTLKSFECSVLAEWIYAYNELFDNKNAVKLMSLTELDKLSVSEIKSYIGIIKNQYVNMLNIRIVDKVMNKF